MNQFLAAPTYISVLHTFWPYRTVNRLRLDGRKGLIVQVGQFTCRGRATKDLLLDAPTYVSGFPHLLTLPNTESIETRREGRFKTQTGQLTYWGRVDKAQFYVWEEQTW